MAEVIPLEGLNSNGLNVTAFLSATLSLRTAYWYGFTSRLNAFTPAASQPGWMSYKDHPPKQQARDLKTCSKSFLTSKMTSVTIITDSKQSEM